MDRFIVRVRDLCTLTALLILGAGAALFAFAFGSSWDFITRDVSPNVTHLANVRVVTEFPVSDATLERLLAGEDLDSPSIIIPVDNKRYFGNHLTSLARRYTSGNLDGIRYAVFTDIDLAGEWFLYHYVSWSPYEFYVNGELKHKSSARSEYMGDGRISLKPGINRLVWVFTNNHPNRLRGFDFHHGLSLRTEQAMVRTYRRLPVQMQFPRIVACTAFLIIGLIALAFALTSPQYLDIWAFTAFCFSIALYIWCKTPMFYEGFYQHAEVLGSINSTVAAASIICAAILSLAYFRLDGRHIRLQEYLVLLRPGELRNLPRRLSNLLVQPFRMIVFSTTVLCVLTLMQFWPMTWNGPVYEAAAHINTRLYYLMLGSQILSFMFGFRCLFQARARFAKQGLQAQVTMMNRRLVLSVIFCTSMAAMLAIYAKGFGKIYFAEGSDYILIAAIFPAAAMLLMFFWMVSSANRFYQRFSPRLGQIDHEVLIFGAKALERRYFGALLVFDLAGMKRLNAIRSQGPEIEASVDQFLSLIEHDLADLIQKGRITHRYKSNGDEFIFAMRAKDPEDAERLVCELTKAWAEAGHRLMAKWRQVLTDSLAAHTDPAIAREIARAIDMHVLITAMKDMKITVKGGIDRPEAAPDFIDPRFTRLSALFKPAKSDKVAMFADDAKRAMAVLGGSASFEPSEQDPETGFLVLERPEIRPAGLDVGLSAS